MKDFYALTLKEVIQELKIQPFDYELHKDKQLETIVLDDWEAVSKFLNEKRNNGRFDLMFSCYGYELIKDNHYIKVYYKVTHSYS